MQHLLLCTYLNLHTQYHHHILILMIQDLYRHLHLLHHFTLCRLLSLPFDSVKSIHTQFVLKIALLNSAASIEALSQDQLPLLLLKFSKIQELSIVCRLHKFLPDCFHALDYHLKLEELPC